MGEAIRAKYTPLPKTKSTAMTGPKLMVDVEKIRIMYVTGLHFRWEDFCKNHNFNPNCREDQWWRTKVRWEEWKKAWIRHRVDLTEEEITPEMLSATKLVAKERIRYVQDWITSGKQLKALWNHLLNEHIQNAAKDQLAANNGSSIRHLKMNISDLKEFSDVGNRIEDMQSKALMMVNDPTRAKQLAEEAKESGSDEIPEFEIVPIGEVMNGQDRTRLLAQYFDQFAEKKEEPPVPVVQEAQIAESDPS